MAEAVEDLPVDIAYAMSKNKPAADVLHKLTDLAAEFARQGHYVTQIRHPGQADGEWVFAEGFRQHASVIVPGCDESLIVLSDGTRAYLDGRVETLAAAKDTAE